MDLVIRGGTVVTAESKYAADVGVREGKIAQIGGEISAAREIDASGKLVIPGGVDVHTHLERSDLLHAGGELREDGLPRMVDDYYAGTAGAAIGGVTTIGNMVAPEPTEPIGLVEMLERSEADALANSMIDFTFHPTIYDPSPEAIAELPRLAEEGYTSIKVFTLYNFDNRVDDFINVIDAAGRNGILTMVHCEDQPINQFLERRQIDQGKSDIRYWAQTRPDYAEAIATARAVAISKAVDAAVYIVHLSSEAALDVTRRANAAGQQVYVETRPIYLHLTNERYQLLDGAKDVGWPPLRDQSNVDALWHGLTTGAIHTVCTDHAPWTLDQKLDPTLNVSSFLPGMANLETVMPMLYSEGVRTGRISANRWVQLVSTNAAKLFGMFPQKGSIAVGSDADLVVWDPDRKRTIRGEEMASNAGYDIYEGWEVQGWPEYTILRGQVIVKDGELTASRGQGRRVIRGPHSLL